jgi:protease-4
MGSTAASGGYYLALGATKIFANSGSVTGSIGVITQLFNVSKLVEKVDVEIHTVKTGEYKDSGSPFREFDDTDEAYFRQLIDDIYDQFITDVAEARKLDKEKVREVADGRVFTGRQAKELKLVDELGTFDDAVNWVAKEAKIEGEPKLAYPVIETSFLAELLKDGVKGAVSEAKIQSTPVIEYRYVGPF